MHAFQQRIRILQRKLCTVIRSTESTRTRINNIHIIEISLDSKQLTYGSAGRVSCGATDTARLFNVHPATISRLLQKT